MVPRPSPGLIHQQSKLRFGVQDTVAGVEPQKAETNQCWLPHGSHSRWGLKTMKRCVLEVKLSLMKKTNDVTAVRPARIPSTLLLPAVRLPPRLL